VEKISEGKGMIYARPIIIGLFAIMLFATGCQATRNVGHNVGRAATAVPFFFLEALLNGIFDTDETFMEREDRRHLERKWKQHWREHPDSNPEMHEAFKDDYE
jgi:hypothetical protein